VHTFANMLFPHFYLSCNAIEHVALELLIPGPKRLKKKTILPAFLCKKNDKYQSRGRK
jgi:hypothetical protein